MSTVLRTPEERFAGLPGYPWAPNYLEQDTAAGRLRMHYLDEGPREAACVYLCLHGNPTWSYLYRRMIPVFLAQGSRVIAPDLFGFGRSDKPADPASYSFDLHRESLLRLVQSLDLQHITLVCQDWGGLLGLTLPMAAPQRYERLLVMNTTLATGDAPLSPGFLAWRSWCETQPDLAVGRLLKRSHAALTAAEAAAYDAPFPSAAHKAGVLAFPKLVCGHPHAPGAALSRQAREFWSQQWSGRSYMAVGMQDPVFGYADMQALRALIRNCSEPLQVPEGGHFVQECGERIAQAALDHWAA